MSAAEVHDAPREREGSVPTGRLVVGLARREALERLRSRAFRISTAIVLLAAVAAVFLPTVFGDDDPSAYTVGAVDGASGPLGTQLEAVAGSDLYVTVRELPGDRQAAEAALDGDVDVVVIDGAELLWEDGTDAELEALVRAALTRLQIAERAGDLGIGEDALTQLLGPVEVESTTLDPDDDGPEAAIATIGMILLFVAITFYGSFILMSVVEEKQNRVVEVLLAHVQPRDLLAAKVLGHGVLGLAQVALIAVVAIVGIAVTDPVDVAGDAYGTIAHVVVWFVLGYAFYSILFASLGSLASRMEDAQSAIAPITIVLMVGYFLAFTIIDSPDGPIAVIGSFLPPSAPLMMPLRAALSDVPLWQIGLAVAVQLLAILALMRLGGRLYRGAVLHVGPRMSLREVWAATS